MIENADKIGRGQLAFEARFLRDLLAHWHEIRHDRRYPDKRAFRPQKFPKFLPQVAIISVNENNEFEDRLIGATVSEILNLTGAGARLVSPPDAGVRKIIRHMLTCAAKTCGPISFKSRIRPDKNTYIPFTALVLPFFHNPDKDILDTLMFAFDFGRKHTIDLVHSPNDRVAEPPHSALK